MIKHTFHKTRFAPTPSGFLHLGNVYSFGLTAKLAKQYGAKILLRIDDMDRERVDVRYVQDIFETLDFLGLQWDEGPKNVQEFEAHYSQIHRLGLYNDALERLKEEGRVYACTCSRTDVLRQNADGIYPGTCREKHLPLDTPNACWRLDTSEKKELIVKTIGGEIMANLPTSMRDFVVRKKDSYPAYQLTSVMDDIHFGIDLIVRGQDLWESTLAQLYLAAVLGDVSFAATTFYHHPLMLAPDGTKLSKSAGDTSVQYLRANGASPSQILSMLGEITI